MMGQAAYRFLVHRNMNFFGLIKPDENDSNVDEGLAYLFAGLGFYSQFKFGFKPPFPLNLVLWPFGIAEYYIKWTITKET
jgi:hypothetical protein